MFFPLPSAPRGEVKRADALLVPIPGDAPKGFKEIEAPEDRKGDATPTGKVRNVWTFRRDNPRGEFVLRAAPKSGGRPALVDAAGRPVARNLVFTVVNPSLGKVRVYATRAAYGPFFTPWTPLPKGSAGKYLQISGSRMSAGEIRALVAGLRLVKTDRAATPTDGGDTKGGSSTGSGSGGEGPPPPATTGGGSAS